MFSLVLEKQPGSWYHTHVKTSSIQVQGEWVTSLLVVSTGRYPGSLWQSLTIAHKRMFMKTNNDEWVCCPVGSVAVAIYESLSMSREFYTIFGCLSWYCYRIFIYKLYIMLYFPQINYILPLIVCLKRLVLGFFFNLLTTLFVCMHAGVYALMG